jgi:hypothetical protein
MLRSILAQTANRHAETRGAQVEFKIADCRQDWKQAFGLIYDCYLRKGLIEPNRFDCRVSQYHLRPQTTVFIAKKEGHVVCTVSLIGDSIDGLPLEEIYGPEIDLKRRQGITLAEVSGFACSSGSLKEFQSLMKGTLRLLSQHAQRFRIHELVAAAHPRHADFYIRTMGFKMFGTETTYPSLHDAPAVAVAMNFAEVEQDRPAFYEAFLGEKIPFLDLLPYPMSPEDAAYFEPMADVSSAFIPLTL